MTATAQNPSEAARQLLGLINGYWGAQAIGTAAELGVADLLAATGPAASGTIANKANADATAILRLLRALTALGLCKQSGEDLFELTALGQQLRSDVAHSVRGRALHVGGRLYRNLADLPAMVRSGRPMSSTTASTAGFHEMAQNPDELHAFQLSMAELSRNVGVAVAEAYDFSRFSTVMDIGGGYGALLAVILKSFPNVQGLVFDLPFLQVGTTHYLEEAGLATRARFVAGDFFKEVPAIADCFVLKYIVHDWDDEHAVRLLRCCRAAASAKKLLLVEQIVPEILSDSPAHRDLMRADLTMMSYGGLERTAGQYRELLSQSGFTMTRIIATQSSFRVIEAEPA